MKNNIEEYGIRDEFGAINLEQLSIENLKYLNHNHAIFYYNNIKYYLKRCLNIEKLYNELIAEELAHDYGIDCSYNDIVVQNGFYYSISSDMRNIDDKYTSMAEILKNLDDSYNNLTDIWNILTIMYKEQLVVQKLMEQLIDIFLFDVLIANVDRHSMNYGIVQNNSEISFSYLFDNDGMLDPISIYSGGYSIGINRDDYFIFENNGVHFLEKFLNVSDSYYLEYFKNKFNILSEDNIASVFNRVEDKIGSQIHPIIQQKIVRKINDNCEVINSVLCKIKKCR